MRPQQNRRMRGRGNNNNNQNRKGPNPLTRSYESNGPDVKIRGTAQQIAEKYTTLARDAQSSGDRVMAENYLQHAEHYNRIIMAAQAQMPQPPVRDMRDEDDGDEDGEDNLTVSPAASIENESSPQPQINGSGPQPVIEGVPAEVAYKQEADTARKPASSAPRVPRRRAAPVGEAAPVADAVVEQSSAQDDLAQAAPAQETASEEDSAPRRIRRPRRPRVSASAEDVSESSASADEPTPEAAE